MGFVARRWPRQLLTGSPHSRMPPTRPLGRRCSSSSSSPSLASFAPSARLSFDIVFQAQDACTIEILSFNPRPFCNPPKPRVSRPKLNTTTFQLSVKKSILSSSLLRSSSLSLSTWQPVKTAGDFSVGNTSRCYTHAIAEKFTRETHARTPAGINESCRRQRHQPTALARCRSLPTFPRPFPKPPTSPPPPNPPPSSRWCQKRDAAEFAVAL